MIHRLKTFLLILAATALLLACAAPTTADTPHIRVLLVYPFGQNYSPYDTAASYFKQELATRVPQPVVFYEAALETARFDDTEVDQPALNYITALFDQQPFDLVVPLGGPAVQFALNHRAAFFPDVPMLAAGVEQRRMQQIPQPMNSAVVAISLDIPGAVAHVLQVLPATTNLVVVFGASPIERFWAAESRRQLQPFADRLSFTWLDNQPLAAMRRQLATMPPHSAVLYGLFLVDAAGEPFEHNRGLAEVHAVANAPIFGFFDSQLGEGIVGGPLLSLSKLGRASAESAARILQGEPPESVQTPVVVADLPAYDWRELKRWGVAPERLPPGSSIRFRQVPFWQRYAWLMALIAAALLAQTAIIYALLASRARNRRAEVEAAELRHELAHAGRIATLGELSASLAHELNQPLTAILSNAQAALRFLAADPPALQELREILQDIVADDDRAGQIIRRLRDLAANRKIDLVALELNALIEETIDLLRSDTVLRNVEIAFEAGVGVAHVRCDRVQLQQVILNLLLNAFDAMQGTPTGARTITVRTQREPSGGLRVSVQDRGTGIAPERLGRLFEPFYTTKPNGLGMGLPISRSIAEAHGGKLWAENNPDGGATFHLNLPDAKGTQ